MVKYWSPKPDDIGSNPIPSASANISFRVGIGRQAGFRLLCQRWCESSTLSEKTKQTHILESPARNNFQILLLV